MQKKNRLLAIFGILSACVGFDQITKSIAINHLRGGLPSSFFADSFRFQYAENAGAFLGLGSSLADTPRFWILTAAVAIFLIVCLFYLFKSSDLSGISIVAFSLVLGGGVSNLIDRIVRTNGRVVDFMNMGIGNLRTGIFNVADVAIMIGIGLLMLGIFMEDHSSATPSKR